MSSLDHLSSFRHCYSYSIYTTILRKSIRLHQKKGDILDVNEDLRLVEEQIQLLDKMNLDLRGAAFNQNTANRILENDAKVI